MRLWGAAEALREQMGMSFSDYDLAQSGYEQDLAAVRSALDEASFDTAWAEGRAMSPEQAIEYALEEPMTPDQEIRLTRPRPPAFSEERQTEDGGMATFETTCPWRGAASSGGSARCPRSGAPSP